MKIAVVYNRDSKNVINLFGMPNREKIGLRTIKRLSDALKKGGHQVISLEADKDLVDRLEDFMPQVVQGERPGMVFNVSYGLQGQARYTHVPSILEMVGIPYVGSGPLGHSLALDKVVTKMLLRQRGVPTPDFAVLDTPNAELPPDLTYPMIVKPKNEAVSFGLKVVDDEDALREAAGVIFNEFRQPVLAEQYITGREINVGILGNDPVEAFQPVLLDFGDGAQIYTYEDKTGRSGRQIRPVCPAPIGDELTEKARQIAIQTFKVLGLNDCARIDMRLDDAGQLFILEANSLPSLGEHGSYLVGADHAGLDFAGFVNRLVDVATARYFGTPSVSPLEAGAKDTNGQILQYVTQNREGLERRLRDWVQLSSTTNDPVGIEQAVAKAARMLERTRPEAGAGADRRSRSLDLGYLPLERGRHATDRPPGHADRYRGRHAALPAGSRVGLRRGDRHLPRAAGYPGICAARHAAHPQAQPDPPRRVALHRRGQERAAQHAAHPRGGGKGETRHRPRPGE